MVKLKDGNPKTRVHVITTMDDWDEAGRLAGNLWINEHRRCGRDLVRVWNQMHPERPVKTTNRYLVFEERR